jgi:hypothetical protein
MRILKKANSNTRSLAYRSLVRPILEYGAACWDPYREGQIRALDRVQNKASRFAHITINSNWETLTLRRKLSRICALFKAYSGDRAWKPIGDRLKCPHYLSRCGVTLSVERCLGLSIKNLVEGSKRFIDFVENLQLQTQ